MTLFGQRTFREERILSKPCQAEKISDSPSYPSFPQFFHCSPFPYSLCHSCGHCFTLIFTFNTLVLNLSVLSLSINFLVQGSMTPHLHCKSADWIAHSVHTLYTSHCTAKTSPDFVFTAPWRNSTLHRHGSGCLQFKTQKNYQAFVHKYSLHAGQSEQRKWVVWI